jgi:predicted ABC-type ATPase
MGKLYKKGAEVNPDNKSVKNYFAHGSGKVGGVLVGKRHSEGGIKAVNKSTGQPLEMEGGEVVITRNAVSDNTKREFNGEMLTNREILSKINESGGGVSFASGGTLPKRIRTSGKEYKYGGKMMKDHDIVSSCGCKHSMAKGGETKKYPKNFKTKNNKGINPKYNYALLLINKNKDVHLMGSFSKLETAESQKNFWEKNYSDKEEVDRFVIDELVLNKMAKGGLAKTPAPKKDRIVGSKKNKPGSAASKTSAKSITLSDEIVKVLKNKVEKYKKDHPSSKLNVNTLKAVMRRGMGAYSSSHRPTISGGAPNSRTAWGFARVNAFLKKKSGAKVKAAYVQDDDLMAKGGELDYTKNALEFFKKELGIKSDVILVQSRSSFDPISMSQLMGSITPKKDNKFYVAVNFNETKNRFIRVLAHELVHVKQMEDERLRFEGDKIIFGNEKMTYDEYQKRYYSDDIPKFEEEAFNLERILQSKYAENENSYSNGGDLDQEITCVNCGWHWNTKDSDESDKYICHKCGFDNRTFYDPEFVGEFNKYEIYKSIGPLRQANETIDKIKSIERQNKMADVGVTKFYKEYLDWYKNGVSDKMTIIISIPNSFSKMSSGYNDVILDVFEKTDESVNGKEKLKELLQLADKNKIDVYLEPIPRYNKIKDEAKKKKITREYLISYYKKFDFELLPNGFMVRKHKNNKIKANYMKAGGNLNYEITCEVLDENGERQIDPQSIANLTKCINNLPQTKILHYDDEKNDYYPYRKRLHKDIIYEFKKDLVCIERDEPIAILMGGSPASGKSTFLKKYAPYLLKEEILKIDADEIRARLPEYKGYNASQTHLETKDIVNTLLSDRNIGIPCRFDLIYDGTMNNTKSYLPLIRLLKNDGYKVFIVYIDKVPKDVIVKRALERYKKSGRFVPLEVIDDFFEKGTTAFEQLKKESDGFMLVDGSNQDYKIIEKGGEKIPQDRNYSNIGEPIKITTDEVIKELKTGGKLKNSPDFLKGKKEELKEHRDTFEKLRKNKLTADQAAELVVLEHLKKKPDYYKKYSTGGKIQIQDKKIVSYKEFLDLDQRVKSPYDNENNYYYPLYCSKNRMIMFFKDGNRRNNYITPQLAYKSFLFHRYKLDFKDLSAKEKNALMLGKQSLLENN